MGKLFTRVINTCLTEWGENYKVYTEDQAGFWSNMGVTNNIIVLRDLITHLINQGKRLFYSFVDLSKAFDFVNRDNLCYKLIKLVIRGSILNVIKRLNKGVRSRVKYENELRSEFVILV